MQGTLYPDVIESVSFKGPSAVIKTHHNVGGLPERMKLELIEPLRELFKDEVRERRRAARHAAAMCCGASRSPARASRSAASAKSRAERLRDPARSRRDRAWKRSAPPVCTTTLWQSFCVLLPVRTVGVMGDGRTYEYVIAIRAVTLARRDDGGLGAPAVRLLARVSTRIINEVRGCNRVVYDISSQAAGHDRVGVSAQAPAVTAESGAASS